MAWRRNLQVSSVGTSAERLGVGADHDGGRAAGAKGAATEETRKGLRLRILPGTGCHRAGPPSKSGARAGGGRSDDFTQSNCGGTEAELATSATTCLHPQPPSRAYICVRNRFLPAWIRPKCRLHSGRWVITWAPFAPRVPARRDAAPSRRRPLRAPGTRDQTRCRDLLARKANTFHPWTSQRTPPIGAWSSAPALRCARQLAQLRHDDGDSDEFGSANECK